MTFNLEDYRRDAERFLEELEREYFEHYAGRKESTDFTGIYERHAQLFERGAIEELRRIYDAAGEGGAEESRGDESSAEGRSSEEAALAGGAGARAAETDERRRIKELLDFALDGYLGQATKELYDQMAEAEATGKISLNGEEMPFRLSASVQTNEADRNVRRGIELLRLQFISERLNPLAQELYQRFQRLSTELGYADYLELSREVRGTDFEALHVETERFLNQTEDVYRRAMNDALKRHTGVTLYEAGRWDLPRLFRATEYDEFFSKDRLMPSLENTLSGLGISLEQQTNIEVDAEARENKSPRAFCATLRVPTDIKLVVMPVGGQDDYQALLHEAGHAEHFAHTDASLPWEFRQLGDNGVTEGFAFLFEHLLQNPDWLRIHVGINDPSDYLRFLGLTQLYFLRRYAGKLAYELELHRRGPSPDMASRYSYHLTRATLVPFPEETYLTDVDEAMYCTNYLRAGIFEANLRSVLEERFGSQWFTRQEAGNFLKVLWSGGQKLRAEELFRQVTGKEMTMVPLVKNLQRLLGA